MPNTLIPWRNRRKHSLADVFNADTFPQLFGESGANWLKGVFEDGFYPRANVAETEEEFSFTLELPGMKEDDVEISVIGNRLCISGERKEESEEKGKHFHRSEFHYGSFERNFELPTGAKLDPDSIAAKFSKGVLEIHVPKVEPQPSAKIRIQGE